MLNSRRYDTYKFQSHPHDQLLDARHPHTNVVGLGTPGQQVNMNVHGRFPISRLHRCEIHKFYGRDTMESPKLTLRKN